jgi:hypothetical protein
MTRQDVGKPKKNLIGFRSGRLLVTGFSHMDKNGHGSLWLCKCDCGNTHITRGTHIVQQKTLSCGCYRKDMFDLWRKDKCGKKNMAYKGGRVSVGGYIKILIPFAEQKSRCDRYILEHRKVMEEKIGRKLKANEIVHHINGIKNDNRIDNLEIVLRNAHRGNVRCPYCRRHFKIQ